MDDAIQLTEEIKAYATEVCKRSNGGCELSKNLIAAHRMMAQMPDSGSIGICREAFEDWKRKYIGSEVGAGCQPKQCT